MDSEVKRQRSELQSQGSVVGLVYPVITLTFYAELQGSRLMFMKTVALPSSIVFFPFPSLTSFSSSDWCPRVEKPSSPFQQWRAGVKGGQAEFTSGSPVQVRQPHAGTPSTGFC